MLAKPVALCASAWLLVMAGCATPGPPLPPSLALPRPVMDLEASRQGNRVLLTWTPPSETTDKLRIRRVGGTAVCRKIEPDVTKPLLSSSNSQCAPIIATIAPADLQPVTAAKSGNTNATHPAPAQRVTYAIEIPADLIQQYRDGAAVFYVEPLNPNGRGAAFSNPAAVPLAPSFPPPANFRAEPTKNAIMLTWTPVHGEAADRTHLAGYRIERSDGGANATFEANVRLFVAAGSASDGHTADTQFTWGKQYQYRVASVTGVFTAEGKQVAEVQGEWSQAVEVAARDVFPPAQPSGLQAVFTQVGGQGYIDLTWLPNAEPDLGGYFVYRRTEGAEPQRLNSEAVKAPAYRDTNVAPGTRYFYSVSAVDLRGNEGPRSEEASESVPKP